VKGSVRVHTSVCVGISIPLETERDMAIMSTVFTLQEAELLRRKIEPKLRRMREEYEKLQSIYAKIRALRERIRLSGGYYALSDTTVIVQALQAQERVVQQFLKEIQRTGVIVRDIPAGLVDFPGELDGEPVFWCWKLDEAKILYYHRQDEGFQGRKLIPFDRLRHTSASDNEGSASS